MNRYFGIKIKRSDLFKFPDTRIPRAGNKYGKKNQWLLQSKNSSQFFRGFIFLVGRLFGIQEITGEKYTQDKSRQCADIQVEILYRKIYAELNSKVIDIRYRADNTKKIRTEVIGDKIPKKGVKRLNDEYSHKILSILDKYVDFSSKDDVNCAIESIVHQMMHFSITGLPLLIREIDWTGTTINPDKIINPSCSLKFLIRLGIIPNLPDTIFNELFQVVTVETKNIENIKLLKNPGIQLNDLEVYKTLNFKSVKIVESGKKVLSYPISSNVADFVKKWNNYTKRGGIINFRLKKIFNEIITRYKHDLVFRVIKEKNSVLLRNYSAYCDLIEKLSSSLSNTQGSRTIFGTWKDFIEGKIMWEVTVRGETCYVRKTAAFSRTMPKNYWNKENRGFIFSNLFFELANTGLKGNLEEIPIRRIIKSRIPALKGKNFQGSIYKLKYDREIINELMTLVWNRKVSNSPSQLNHGGIFQQFTVTRQSFILDTSNSHFVIFQANFKSIKNECKEIITLMAKKTDTWNETKKNIDIPGFINEVDNSTLIESIKTVILDQCSNERAFITIENVNSLGFDVNTTNLWSSEYELQKVASGALKSLNIREKLGYLTPSENIDIKYGSLGKLLSNPDIISVFKIGDKKVAREVVETKVLEKGLARVSVMEFLTNLILCIGYLTGRERVNIGKSYFFVKFDDPLLGGTKIGRVLKGLYSALLVIDFNESVLSRFAEIFNEVRLEYFGKRQKSDTSFAENVNQKLRASSSAYGLDLTNVEEKKVNKIVSKLEDIAIKSNNSQYAFVLEVFLNLILGNWFEIFPD